MPEKTFRISANAGVFRERELNSLERILKMYYMLISSSFDGIQEDKFLDKLQVSQRTLYRYKRKLEDIGIFIEINKKIWKIKEDKNALKLNRLSLSYEDLLSLLIAEKLIENYSDISVQKHFQDLMLKHLVFFGNKFEQSVFDYVKERIDTIKKKPFNIERFPHSYLIDIQKALAEHKILDIQYYVFHKDKTTIREIIPIELSFYRAMWHIKAYCTLKKDYREFRLDRIINLKITKNKFKPTEYTIDKYNDSRKNSLPETEVSVFFDLSIERLIHTGKYNFTILHEKKNTTGIYIKFGIDRFKTDEFIAWLLGWGNNCKILKPTEYIHKIKEKINVLAKHYR